MEVADGSSRSQEDAGMSTPLLSLIVRSQRDLCKVRQRVPQIAVFLGFDWQQLAACAAAVFELTCCSIGRGSVCFGLTEDSLYIRYMGSGARSRLVFPLPDRAATPASEDIPWLVQQLDQLTPLNLFEEFR